MNLNRNSSCSFRILCRVLIIYSVVKNYSPNKLYHKTKLQPIDMQRLILRKFSLINSLIIMNQFRVLHMYSLKIYYKAVVKGN